ncbi:hypothetical protein FHS31_000053 [Sphingomonas vulcanisoli]|uniref:Transglycosylase SLT domain-containing protein n=1 Tax=Sphingomonas vulcanisoli TaxID=1658060 RepID=A0ABX0TLZ7_9SPHN|nr:hypothetical protein [Sphingomonas vulcanisoli]
MLRRRPELWIAGETRNAQRSGLRRSTACLWATLAFATAALSPAIAADAVSFTTTPAVADQGLLTPAERTAYRTAFAAIRSGDWTSATAAIDAMPAGLLTPIARAELYLAKGAPQPDPMALTALITASPQLPQAPALGAKAIERGATALPAMPTEHDLVRTSAASRRQNVRSTRADAASARVAAQLQPLFKVNDAASAEPIVEAASAQLSPEALTEWRQRVAWTYLLANDDANARRVATMARAGAGEWASQADWVLGLAAWRAGDMDAASEAFAATAGRSRDPEMIAAGLFWAARADTAGGHPDRVAPRLRSAARMDETFYGLLARQMLGMTGAEETPALAPGLPQTPNAVTAAALIEVGEPALADRVIRREARIGSWTNHAGLIQLAARLNLPATQLWLAQNSPAGMPTSLSARYPMPAGWMPTGGWRVDRALCMAHALQESQFRMDATSHAGARGVMQLMPATARLVARHKGDAPEIADRLSDPAVSFEYGQSYLQELADNMGATGGLLPKVIAAYNAGPNNVAAWNVRPGASTDPLFFIETIPFAETRGYVATVLRNYWMYQRESGVRSESLAQLAEGKWPRFPVAAVVRRTAMNETVGTAAGLSN